MVSKRELDARQRELIREIGWRAYEVHRAWWRPLRNHRLRREIQQLDDEGQRLYARYRDGRLQNDELHG